LPDAAQGGRDGASSRAWGAWESAAATVLFSAPALLLFCRALAGSGVAPAAFDWLDSLAVGASLLGGLALSLAAGGPRFAVLYLVMGLSSCLIWFLFGLAIPVAAPLTRVYAPVILADLLALVAVEILSYTLAGRARG